MKPDIKEVSHDGTSQTLLWTWTPIFTMGDSLAKWYETRKLVSVYVVPVHDVTA